MDHRKTGDVLTSVQKDRFSGALSSLGSDIMLVEQRVIPMYFKEVEGRDVYTVATDTFIGKSKATYTPGWLAREIVQNFVDHNTADPGTLNGVRVDVVDMSIDPSLPKGTKRFIITGSWKFEKPVGIISFHSEKPTDMETAGGNGIGLKQTALRFLRDFDVKKFAIEGEKWRVNYELAQAAQINAALPEGIPGVEHDWLVADLEKTTNTGETRYIIETADPILIAALDQFEEIGVKDTNRFLVSPDVENEFGSLKWLATANEEGRIFMNGQAFHYERVGDTPETYFTGPKGVVLRLNNVRYKMSVDRPPMSPSDLKSYAENFLRSLTGEQLLDQIFLSHTQWAGQATERYKSSSGAIKLVEQIVSLIKIKEQLGLLTPQEKTTLKKFSSQCREEKCLATTRSLSPKERSKLTADGYVLCPEFFVDIGMATVDSVLSEHDRLDNERPELSEYDELYRARRGVEVGYSDIEAVNVGALVDQIKTTIESYGGVLVAGESPTALVIHVPCDVPDEHAFAPLFRARKEQEKRLLWMRGIIVAGLEKGLFSRAFMKHGDYIVTCAVVTEKGEEYAPKLIVKVIDNSASGDKRKGVGVYVDCATAEARALLDGSLAEQSAVDAVRQLKSKGEQVRVGTDEQKGSLVEQPVETLTKPLGSQDNPRTLSMARQNSPSSRLSGVVSPARSAQQKNGGWKRWVVAALGTLGLAGLVRLGSDSRESAPDSDTIITIFEKIGQAIQDDVRKEIERRIEVYVQDPRQREVADQNRRELRDWLAQHGGVRHDDSEVTRTINQLRRQYQNNEVLPSTIPDRHDHVWGVPENNVIEDFEIVRHPTEIQALRLELLRRYVILSIGIDVPNNLFTYTGRGAYGVNFNRQNIGIHAEVLGGDFESALQTFVHEVAHNYAMGHGHDFIQTQEVLFVSVIDTLGRTNDSLLSGTELSSREQALLDIEGAWNRAQ